MIENGSDPRSSERGSWISRCAAVLLVAPASFGLAPAEFAARVSTPSGASAPRHASADSEQDPRQDPEEAEEAELLAAERKDADLDRRRGRPEAGLRRLEELLDERATDAEARLLAARCELELCRWDAAEANARRALADLTKTEGRRAGDASPDVLRPAAARLLAEILTLRGRARDALTALDDLGALGAAERDPRTAWTRAQALFEVGRRDDARRALEQGMANAAGEAWGAAWERTLARASCARRLGRIEEASQLLVQADEEAVADGSAEPDVLALLADLYFEADREVAGPSERRSANKLFEEALRLDPQHEAAALGRYRVYRYNWQRQRESSQQMLNDLLARRPESIEALIVAAGADLDDGQLKAARERLKRLGELAPARRSVRTLEASLAWLDHREDASKKILAELLAIDPQDGMPEREVGRHLLELYRFAEGLPFLKSAVERDPLDWDAWTQLGRALANTGDEKAALEALAKADEVAAGRQDAWRNNMRLVLTKMQREHERETQGPLTFAWNEDAAEILRTYLAPFYAEARAELARRYGYTPGPTAIEVFQKHADFSVRSTGFEGFPALGVCFGPVVTAVSPLAEMRGTFSWARTSFHEFTHVIHLGISHNRCPRWVTEGLATWEEVAREPSWTRNMRRDLVDALANDDLIPVRELNRAFRGPRILFGYYEGGLLCQMLIERSGFPPMVRLLESFDRGADVDQAFQEVFQTTPEAIDRDFRAFVEKLVKDLRIEPRWSDATIARLRLSLSTKKPDDPARVAAWAEGWCSVAWHAWQRGRRVDAQEALRMIASIAPPPRALFLRGEMALKDGERDKATELWKQAFDAGGEDFRARMASGMLARDAGDLQAAEAAFVAAEKVFPGYDERDLCAELALAKLYTVKGRPDDALAATERWLVYESGALEQTRAVAAWHLAAGRAKESLRYFGRANEIDPFRWRLHAEWGDALLSLQDNEAAAREFRVARLVPASLEGDQEGPPSDAQRAELFGKEAQALLALDRKDAASDAAQQALELDPDCEAARGVLDRLR